MNEKLITFRKTCGFAIKETYENVSLIYDFVTENYRNVSWIKTFMVIANENEGSLWGDGNVLKLDLGNNGCTTPSNFSWSCVLQAGKSCGYKLYLKNAYYPLKKSETIFCCIKKSSKWNWALTPFVKNILMQPFSRSTNVTRKKETFRSKAQQKLVV